MSYSEVGISAARKHFEDIFKKLEDEQKEAMEKECAEKLYVEFLGVARYFPISIYNELCDQEWLGADAVGRLFRSSLQMRISKQNVRFMDDGKTLCVRAFVGEDAMSPNEQPRAVIEEVFLETRSWIGKIYDYFHQGYTSVPDR